jgi:hypothetical protein
MSERQALLQTKKETVSQLDKALLTLDAGALAISITFLKEIAPKPSTGTIFFLILGWISFIASLICTLYSFRKSAEAFDRQIGILDNETQKELHGKPSNGEQNSAIDGQGNNRENMPAKQLKWLNLLSLWSFIIGVVLLCAFAGANMWIKSKGAKVSEKDKIISTTTKPELIKEGVEPPTTPVKPPPPQQEKSSK